MCHHHQLNIRIQGKSPAERLRRHIPCIVFRINKHRFSAFVDDRIHGRSERHIGTEHAASIEATAPSQSIRRGDTGAAAVQLLCRQLYRQMKRRRSRTESNGILCPNILAGHSFQLVDILSHGTHPVGLVRPCHILQFFPVHRRGRQPYLFRKRLHSLKSRIGFYIHDTRSLSSLIGRQISLRHG